MSEPGAVVTEMLARGVATAERLAKGMTSARHERYDRLVGAINPQARTFARDGVPASVAADVIAEAVTSKRPNTHYTAGREAVILANIARVTPDRLLHRILNRNLTPGRGGAGTLGEAGPAGRWACDEPSWQDRHHGPSCAARWRS